MVHALLQQDHAHAEKVKELRAERDDLAARLEELVEAVDWFHEARSVHEWISDSWDDCRQTWSWLKMGESFETLNAAEKAVAAALQRAKDVEA
jgi:hypothetical protein